MAASKVAVRRITAKRPREGDTGHVITGIGHAYQCSCGARGSLTHDRRAAMAAGVAHAAMHAADYEPGSITPPPSFPPPAAPGGDAA